MKKTIRNCLQFIFLILVTSSTNAQNLFIDFESIAAKDIAVRDLNKEAVFVYLYSKWSEGCKTFEKEVLPNAQIVKHYNGHFTNIKIEYDQQYRQRLESILGLEPKTLPALLFYRNGKLYHYSIGFLSKNEFYHLGDIALDETKNLYGLEKQYISKTIQRENMPDLAEIYLNSGINKYEGVILQYLENEKDWNTKKNIRLIFKFGRPTLQSPLFKYTIDNRDIFLEHIDLNSYEHKLDFAVEYDLRKARTESFTLDETINFFNRYYKQTNIAKNKALAFHTKSLFFSNDREEQERLLQIIFDITNKDKEKYNARFFNNLAYEVMLRTDDEVNLIKCLEWIKYAEQSVQGHEFHDAIISDIHDTKANILLKLKRYPEALKAINKAISWEIQLANRHDVVLEWKRTRDKIKKAMAHL